MVNKGDQPLFVDAGAAALAFDMAREFGMDVGDVVALALANARLYLAAVRASMPAMPPRKAD